MTKYLLLSQSNNWHIVHPSVTTMEGDLTLVWSDDEGRIVGEPELGGFTIYALPEHDQQMTEMRSIRTPERVDRLIDFVAHLNDQINTLENMISELTLTIKERS